MFIYMYTLPTHARTLFKSLFERQERSGASLLARSFYQYRHAHPYPIPITILLSYYCPYYFITFPIAM